MVSTGMLEAQGPSGGAGSGSLCHGIGLRGLPTEPLLRTGTVAMIRRDIFRGSQIKKEAEAGKQSEDQNLFL